MILLYSIILTLTFLLAGLLYKVKTNSSGRKVLPSLLVLGVGGLIVKLEFTELPINVDAVEKAVATETNHAPTIIPILDQTKLNVSIIRQLPELPRGCEVTSLAMLLQYAGVPVDKMVLAAEIKKDTSRYIVDGDKIYFGHPNEGFVGNMYTKKEPGLGVYHKPIAELAERYLPGQITDLTGQSFQDIKTHLSDGRPVWVITNTTYKRLPENMFVTWHTSKGKINVTYKEHSVLLTGYDETYVYFNDPLTGTKNKKAPIADFEQSWVQMGSQAITYRNRN